MYALVAPLVRLPRSLMPGAFDYAVPPELEGQVAAGSLVRVPWRNRPLTAVVLEVRSQPDFAPAKVKPLTALLHPTPLPADCLAGLRLVAEDGVVPLANAAHALVPESPARNKGAAAAMAQDAPTVQVAAVPLRATQLRYRQFAEKTALLLDAVRPHLADGRAALVLVPHLDDLPPLEAALTAALADVPLAVLDSSLAKVPAWQRWTAGLEPGPHIVLGTRGACLAPLASLGVIVVVEAPSRDHRSFDQQPKFDAREVARQRARVAGAELLILSATGRTEDTELAPATTASPTLVDTSGTRGQEGALFPEPLRAAVEDALEQGVRAAIVHNRRGSFRVLACAGCNAPAHCSQCKSLATLHGTALRCHRCGWQGALPTHCSGCGLHKLEPRGWGVGELAASVRAAFPEAAVVVADTESKSLPERWDVAVGTVALTHALQELPCEARLGVVAVNADSLLGGTDFRGTERAWQAVSSLTALADAHDAPCLVLTRKPDAPATRRLLQDEATFLAAERADRAAAGYPPAAKLITITCAGPNPGAALAAAKAAKAVLLQQAPALARSVFGPYPAGTPLRHGSWRAAFALKVPALTPELRASLAKIPETCSIDTNPESPE